MGLDLSKYSGLFTENDVDWEILSDLEELDLEKVELSLGHRKKLLKAIAALSEDAGTVDHSAKPNRSLAPLLCCTLSYSICLKRGSRVSLSQSPNRFRDITVSVIANPGKAVDHQIPPASLSRPSVTMEPHAGVGGGTPAPRKLRVDSSKITIPT